ncbi:hypothetical protein FB561_6804 [Kribbella amoyensis]|uniref:Uncharacterized protein n=1 Tax=Kribbella amoyensis TaxID=996641 RepID=A0A561B8S3_9ACTN|nr:hypothetical protein FB561_6804 [Kribbella amoyensis]
MLPALLLTVLLAPRLLLVATLLRALLAGALAPAATLLTALLATLSGLALLWLLRLPLLRLLVTGLLTPTAALLRLLRLLAPSTLAGLLWLLSPAAALTLSPLLPARLAPRLPRTPRSLWRRRHSLSFGNPRVDVAN